jgi:hypothetical protein
MTVQAGDRQAAQLATHETCCVLLAVFPVLADLHPGNRVVMTEREPVVMDFTINPRLGGRVQA